MEITIWSIPYNIIAPWKFPGKDGVHGQHLEQKDPDDYNAFRG